MVDTRVWSLLATEGQAPIARDSHVAVINSNSMYIFGGSTGTAVNDFYELSLGKLPGCTPTYGLGKCFLVVEC